METAERAGVNRRGLLLGGGGVAFGSSFARASESGFPYNAALQQGGYLIGITPVPLRGRAEISLDGEVVGQGSQSNRFIVGFDRDAGASTRVKVGRFPEESLRIAPVTYDVQRIDGLPADQVAPSDPALLARIKRELARKSAAFASRDDTENFKDGFVWPLEHAIRTSKFGPQRILNGVPKTPHYGVDLAAPAGTPIGAPAPGLVVFADPAMHFEGGLTLIDHGQGLISAYLHQSAQSVRVGERVVRGQEIGRVGMTGRATGPHLCWRLTWRGRHMDPSLMVGASAPA